jgi:hypothetical protein
MLPLIEHKPPDTDVTFIPPHYELTSLLDHRKVISLLYLEDKKKKFTIKLAHVAGHLTYIPQVYEVIFILFYSQSSSK